MDSICRIKGIKKEEYPELYETVESVCEKFNLKTIRVTVWPWGFNAAAIFVMDWLLVTKDLLKAMNKDELEAIVAHEFSHIFNRHGLTMLATLFIFYAPFLGLHSKYSAEYSAAEIFNNPLLFFPYLVSIIWLLIGFRGINWVSVRLETNADIQAIYKTQKPEALKRALLKLRSKGMVTDKRPTRLSKISESVDWVVRYFFGFSHPSIAERIGYMEKYDLLSTSDEFR